MQSRIFNLPVLFLLLVIVVIGVVLYQRFNADELPADIASGNGRIEATDIIVASRLPGRVQQVFVDEGDLVKKGQKLAQMDTAPLEALLREAEARLEQAKESKRYAEALVAVRDSERTLSSKQYERLKALVEGGNAPIEQLDQSLTKKETAEAALQAARIQVIEAGAAIEAIRANVARVKTDIEDSVLLATADGRVLYRLAEPGEVVGAGGRVLVLVDLLDTHMSIFLPTSQASVLSMGDEARIVLDALPNIALPASISFVSPVAQFTPKMVETRVEREQLMFRVKLKINTDLLMRHIDVVKTGVPGEGYVRLKKEAVWPEALQNIPE